MTAEALKAFREQASVNAETLAALDAELKPFFMEERELKHAIARTYPHRIDSDRYGGPVPIVTGWSSATDERLELRARLDTIQIETAGLRLDRAEHKRLVGWYAGRIMELEAELRNPPKPQKPENNRKTTHHEIQPKLL
jgi:hypothetical protein